MMSHTDFRIGNQTSFAAASLFEPFEFAIANGFRAFEFFPDRGFAGTGGWDEREVSHEQRKWIRRVAKDNGMTLSVHAPLEFDPLKNHRDDRLYSTVEFARSIGAGLLNLHLDTCQGIEPFVEALETTLRLTADAGLRLAIENTVHTGPEEFNALFSTPSLKRHLQDGRIGMTFDSGHANLFAATRNDLWRYLDGLSEQVPIIHLHVHENYGDRDSHLTLFTGPAGEDSSGLEGMLGRLIRRNFDGCAIFEQWPHPPSLLTAARDGLLRLLECRHTPLEFEPGTFHHDHL